MGVLVTNRAYFLIFSSLIVFEFQPFVILRRATLKEILVNLESLQVHLKSSFEILLFAILRFRPAKNLSKIEFEIYGENINQNVFKNYFKIRLRVLPKDFLRGLRFKINSFDGVRHHLELKRHKYFRIFANFLKQFECHFLKFRERLPNFLPIKIQSMPKFW